MTKFVRYAALAAGGLLISATAALAGPTYTFTTTTQAIDVREPASIGATTTVSAEDWPTYLCNRAAAIGADVVSGVAALFLGPGDVTMPELQVTTDASGRSTVKLVNTRLPGPAETRNALISAVGAQSEEPTTWRKIALLGAGLCGLGLIARRHFTRFAKAPAMNPTCDAGPGLAPAPGAGAARFDVRPGAQR